MNGKIKGAFFPGRVYTSITLSNPRYIRTPIFDLPILEQSPFLELLASGLPSAVRSSRREETFWILEGKWRHSKGVSADKKDNMNCGLI